jgi:hypothetical protein
MRASSSGARASSSGARSSGSVDKGCRRRASAIGSVGKGSDAGLSPILGVLPSRALGTKSMAWECSPVEDCCSTGTSDQSPWLEFD